VSREFDTARSLAGIRTDIRVAKAALADSMYSESSGRKQPLFIEGDLAELLKPLSV
jgi:hypothetical protein